MNSLKQLGSIARPATRLYSTASGQQASTVYSSLVLSRIPIVTPELSAFEQAYYRYQNELEKRLMWTFPAYFYFKKGTLSERKFVAAQRGPVVRQPGVWYPKGLPDIKFNRERRAKQEISIPREKGADAGASDSVLRPVVGNPRRTAADAANDTTALTRSLDRTLYLLVKQGAWKFPAFGLRSGEALHEAGERGLRELGGPGMHTWTVSNTPCAVLRFANADGTGLLGSEAEDVQSREYLIKSHIVHGKFVPQDGVEYAWLAKDEIKERVTPEYWAQVADLISNQ